MKKLIDYIESIMPFYLFIMLAISLISVIVFLSDQAKLAQEQKYMQIVIERLPEETRQQIFNNITELQKQHKQFNKQIL